MKHKALTVTALLLSCANMAGCETYRIVRASDVCDIVYVSTQDSEDTLRQNLSNNKALDEH